MEKLLWRGSTDMITKDSPNYSQVVIDNGERDYAILAKNIPAGESVVCPHDPDMTIKKESDDSVILNKRCYKPNCFSK